MPESETSLGIPALSLPTYVALGKWPNLSVPLFSSLENKNNNNNNTYFVMLWGIKEQRYDHLWCIYSIQFIVLSALFLLSS